LFELARKHNANRIISLHHHHLHLLRIHLQPPGKREGKDQIKRFKINVGSNTDIVEVFQRIRPQVFLDDLRHLHNLKSQKTLSRNKKKHATSGLPKRTYGADCQLIR
jgi:hypothetical protein